MSGDVVMRVLADSDLMVLICETMGVVATRALSRTCRAIHEVLRAQLAAWRMQWYAAKENPGGPTRAVARAGHLKLLRWRLRWRIEKRRLQWDPCITADAAAGGHLAVLKWLRERGVREGTHGGGVRKRGRVRIWIE